MLTNHQQRADGARPTKSGASHKHGDNRWQGPHPYTVGFCGFSDSGKTTLITRLLEDLSQRYSVGFLKSDAHGFAMDREGKDTWRAWESGAAQVLIQDDAHSAVIERARDDRFAVPATLLQQDIVLVEGHKDSVIPKYVFLDSAGEMAARVGRGELQNILGFICAGEVPAVLPLDRPCFQREAVDEVLRHLLEYVHSSVSETPLYGLILTGGKSTRMGEDKSRLEYHGKTQVDAAYELLQPFCGNVYVSGREGQWQADELSLPVITDRFAGFGPIGGILSAMSAYPKAAWLVLACDLPFLQASDLAYLISQRNALRFATCFDSAAGLPEPLCAIYEPKAYTRILQLLGFGHECPRKMLLNSAVQRLDLPRAEALANINTPAERQAAENALAAMAEARFFRDRPAEIANAPIRALGFEEQMV